MYGNQVFIEFLSITYSADVGALSAEAGEEIKKLREEILDLKERNNMLEFKIELLIDMVSTP